jgi:hypothetical protein
LLAVLAFLTTGCFGESEKTPPGTAAPGSLTEAVSEKGVCPVTLPNRSVPADATDWPATDSHGNGEIWTLFWPHNLVIADAGFVEEDGTIGMKWPWWRGVDGELKIRGRRLDAEAPPLTAEIPPGYGLSGFQPSGISFPTEGCWQITGSVGGATLTFVSFIVKAETYALKGETE